MIKRRLTFLLPCWFAISLVGSAFATDEFDSVLVENGIEPDRVSIEAYLNSLLPTSQAKQRFARLISQLGDEDFARREDAMTQLMRSPIYAADMLKAAAKSDDREVGYRAKLILEQADANYSRILTATFRVVEHKEIAGLTESILRTIPLCAYDHVFNAAKSALAATASAQDTKLLHREIRSSHVTTRVAAIHAAAHVALEDTRPLLIELLGDRESSVSFESALALANSGDRRCLGPLVRLLDADDLSIRVRAIQTLRGLTGKHFGYAAYVAKSERLAAVSKWQEWSTITGKTAKLEFPLKQVQVELGRTLICQASQHKVIELDAAGKQVWEKDGLKYPWRAEGLPNGHRLVASYNGRAAFEYDARGKEVWKVEGLPGGPHSVQRLENGNTLMACSDSHQIVEVSREGKTVWTVTIAGRPVDAERLPNGRTMAVMQSAGQIVEVDRGGKVHWKIEGLQGPNTAQRLENGNLLISEINVKKVSERTRDGKTVWSIDLPSSPYDAQRLADGTTVVAESGRVTIFDRDGKKVSERTTNGDTRVTRY